MTLLFFLRSPAGNTDTGQSPDGPIAWRYEDERERLREERKKRRLELKLLKLEERAKRQKRKKRREEELLLLLIQEVDFDD